MTILKPECGIGRGWEAWRFSLFCHQFSYTPSQSVTSAPIVRISFRIFQMLPGKMTEKKIKISFDVKQCCSLGQGFNLSGKPVKNWGHEMALQGTKCPGKNCRMWRGKVGWKRLVRAIEAPLLETISLLPVNTLLTRTPNSCRLQCNNTILSVSFWIFQIWTGIKKYCMSLLSIPSVTFSPYSSKYLSFIAIAIVCPWVSVCVSVSVSVCVLFCRCACTCALLVPVTQLAVLTGCPYPVS